MVYKNIQGEPHIFADDIEIVRFRLYIKVDQGRIIKKFFKISALTPRFTSFRSARLRKPYTFAIRQMCTF